MDPIAAAFMGGVAAGLIISALGAIIVNCVECRHHRRHRLRRPTLRVIPPALTKYGDRK